LGTRVCTIRIIPPRARLMICPGEFFSSWFSFGGLHMLMLSR
jgi:hypothetical protein